MKNNWTHERIPRRADCLQWDGKNTDQILGFLTKHEMIGEVYREGKYIMIRSEQKYFDTLAQEMWLLEGEDKQLRIYENDTFKLMYRPIVEESISQSGLLNDELERLRAFARDVLNREGFGIRDIGRDELIFIGNKYGILKAAA